eukprot:GHVR01004395.1.p3 GENE.GHVR01004395.1~~GHVR01004395.1.p3  ORF type:complete len:122 (-),score=16.41 GHVR01004395.1:786-1151(-)
MCTNGAFGVSNKNGLSESISLRDKYPGLSSNLMKDVCMHVATYLTSKGYKPEKGTWADINNGGEFWPIGKYEAAMQAHITEEKIKAATESGVRQIVPHNPSTSRHIIDLFMLSRCSSNNLE